jgi:hypothetical protein
MSSPDTIIEYEESLIFAACEFRWSKGDKFALIEAIAICAANDLQYPNWVRSRINTAMTGLFGAVFPGQDLTNGRPGLGISHLPEGRELADMKNRFKEALKTTNRTLCLKSDTHVLTTHINAVRDFHLAELVATFAGFEIDPRPTFSEVTNLKHELAAALRHTRLEWEDIESNNGDIGQIGEIKLRARDVPAVCRMATFHVIRDAWNTYKAYFLADKTANFQDVHGVNLSE